VEQSLCYAHGCSKLSDSCATQLLKSSLSTFSESWVTWFLKFWIWAVCSLCLWQVLWWLTLTFTTSQWLVKWPQGSFLLLCRTTYQSIAFVAEAVVFIYLGLSFMHYVTSYTISLGFFGLELLVCIISRLTAIFVLAYTVKLFSKWILTANEMAIISTAGTIRGSVAFALILTV